MKLSSLYFHFVLQIFNKHAIKSNFLSLIKDKASLITLEKGFQYYSVIYQNKVYI